MSSKSGAAGAVFILKGEKSHGIHLCVAFYSFKNVQDWLYVERYPLQQLMHSMLFCVTQNNNSSLGIIHVDHIL